MYMNHVTSTIACTHITDITINSELPNLEEEPSIELHSMSSDWLEFLKHLFVSISKRLVQLLQSLRSNIAGISCSKVSSGHRPPMLLVHTDEKFTWTLYNELENKFIDLQIRLPMKRFCGCSKGWLIAVEKDLTITLINPFSRIKGSNKKNSIIRLPKLNLPVCNKPSYYNYCVYKATISADPTLDEKDCIVVFIYEGSLDLAILRLAKDTTWTYIDWAMTQNVVRIEDRHYCVDGYGNFMAFDNKNINLEDIALQEIEEKDDDYGGFQSQIYLVDSVEKGVLMVYRYIRYRRFMKHKTKFFRIYKLNLDDGKWIEKKSLGDVALFIGDNTSISVLASNFPGCRPNCIYFNHDNDRIAEDNVPSRAMLGSPNIGNPYGTQMMCQPMCHILVI